MNNVIFKYRSGIVRLGRIKPFASASDQDINQYWASDDPSYLDWSTLDVKKGDGIYWDKPGATITGKKTKNFTTTLLGRVNSETSIKFQSDTAVGADAYEASLGNNIRPYISRNISKSGIYVYSYPIKNYVGAATYSESILSLFFERTAGLIDEVRLDININDHESVLNGILFNFRNPKNNGDVYIGSGKLSGSVSYISGVNKVITSISKNVN